MGGASATPSSMPVAFTRAAVEGGVSVLVGVVAAFLAVLAL